MEELLKLAGAGPAQLILALGYIPAFLSIKLLWKERVDLQVKIIEMLALKFADAMNARDLWSAQAEVTQEQTRTIASLEKRIADLIEQQRRRA